MKLASREKSMIAWVLYFSILFGSLLCAMGHGQMAGLRLSAGSTKTLPLASTNIR